MIAYNVEIPDDRQQFFKEFIELIGGKFNKSEIDFLINDEQKKILDQRLNEDKASFISARESLAVLRQKYDL